MGRTTRSSVIVRIQVESDADGVAVCRDVVTRQTVRIESHPSVTVGSIRTVELVAGALVRKSSVVAAQRVVVLIEHVGDLIGRLCPEDRCRLGMTP